MRVTKRQEITCEYADPHPCKRRAEYKVYFKGKVQGYVCAECVDAFELRPGLEFRPIQRKAAKKISAA